jgi:hypothetical protein
MNSILVAFDIARRPVSQRTDYRSNVSGIKINVLAFAV